VGRKQILTKSPVKTIAKKHGIEAVENLKMLHVTRSMFHGIDIAFLFAYGDLISNHLLHVPKLGFWNTHPSLLPLYRGPAPIAYPLIIGDKKTGVTLIQLDKEIDHGPIIAQEVTEILPHERRPDLEVRLTDLAYELFKRTLNVIARNGETKQSQVVISSPQNHSYATFTRQLEKNDGFIPFSILKKALRGEHDNWKPKIVEDYIKNNRLVQITNYKLPITIYHLCRGLYPWPGIWTLAQIKGQKKRLKLTDMDLIDNQLILKKVQLEGKKEVDFKTFQSAYHAF
jgi:methionyl-tRNA formyltransferase